MHTHSCISKHICVSRSIQICIILNWAYIYVTIVVCPLQIKKKIYLDAYFYVDWLDKKNSCLSTSCCVHTVFSNYIFTLGEFLVLPYLHCT